MNSFTESILSELENNEDGSFQIRNLGGFAYLKVYKPGKLGKKVKPEEVFARLKLFGIEDYDRSEVEKIVKEADGEDHKIAKWTGGSPVDSRLELEISEDAMQASAILIPAKHGGSTISLEDAKRILENNKIVYGIKEDVLEKLITGQKYYIKTVIAEGKPPVSATNGYIKVLFDTSHRPNLKPESSGRVDFKNINLIKSVQKGEILAEKVDPHPGEIGKNIFGMDLPFEVGKPGEWKVGTNCELIENGKKLISTISGRPILERDGTIRVDEIIQLENVDYSTGNIDFPGTIIVEGTVADNFTLRTKGSLFIKKSVGRVFLHAEKDIVLSGGVMGRNGGYIEAGGDIFTKFVEQGNLKAGGSIFIEEASLHSNLVAGEAIVIQGGRGELIGGEAIAGSYISVSKLGAVVETKTSVVVGMSPQIFEELKKMKEDMASKEEILRKVRQSLQKFNDMIANKKEISLEEKETLKKLLELEKKYMELSQSLKTQYESILSSYDAETEAYIEVEKFIYPRVNINFGKGKQFNSELKTIEGKVFIYIQPDGTVQDSKLPPKNFKKKEEYEKPTPNIR
jgi:uncharacterized protein (DUF342 family)